MGTIAKKVWTFEHSLSPCQLLLLIAGDHTDRFTQSQQRLLVIKLIISFQRRQGMDVEAFRDYHRQVHVPLLFSIPEAQKIQRFAISYPLLEPGLPETRHDAVVEAWFDEMEDMSTLFASENFKVKVDPDHVHFIDLPSVERTVANEIIVVERWLSSNEVKP